MKKIKENLKETIQSKKFSKFIIIFGIFIIAIFIFQAGIFIGFHKASFGRDWTENYGRNFGMIHAERLPFKGGLMDMQNFPNAHGAVGKIIKIELPTIIVKDKDETEKVLLIKDETSIISGKKEITKNDLKIDDFIVVIGSPNNQGQIEAKLVRIMSVGKIIAPKNNK